MFKNLKILNPNPLDFRLTQIESSLLPLILVSSAPIFSSTLEYLQKKVNKTTYTFTSSRDNSSDVV